MADSFELLQYLGRTEIRVRVLAAVAGAPRSRAALQAEMGVPRATVCRVLDELSRRELVAVEGDRFATTSLGRSIVSRLAGLSESVETVRRLQSGLLDSGGPAAGRQALGGSVLTLPTLSDPDAPTRRVTDLVGSATRVGVLAPTLIPHVLWGSGVVTSRRREVEVVVPRAGLDATSSDRCRISRPYRVTGGTVVYAYAGDLPAFVGHADATTFVAATDGGTMRGCIETDDEAVRSLVVETVEAYRREAEPVAPGVLTA